MSIGNPFLGFCMMYAGSGDSSVGPFVLWRHSVVLPFGARYLALYKVPDGSVRVFVSCWGRTPLVKALLKGVIGLVT